MNVHGKSHQHEFWICPGYAKCSCSFAGGTLADKCSFQSLFQSSDSHFFFILSLLDFKCFSLLRQKDHAFHVPCSRTFKVNLLGSCSCFVHRACSRIYPLTGLQIFLCLFIGFLWHCFAAALLPLKGVCSHCCKPGN